MNKSPVTPAKLSAVKYLKKACNVHLLLDCCRVKVAGHDDPIFKLPSSQNLCDVLDTDSCTQDSIVAVKVTFCDQIN